MHIIGGQFKGRVIEMPKGIKPTSNKAREALFEILKAKIEGSSFLDLYCGSGAIGIEALSRGAKSVTFSDNNPNCIKILKKNLAQLDILNQSIVNIYHKDALKALEAHGEPFDVIFLDPPYYKDIAKNTLMAISNYDILARNTLIVIEIYKKDILPEEIGNLKKFRTSTYGDTKLEFFKI